MKNLICNKQFDIRMFTWNGNKGATEASDLGPDFPLCQLFAESTAKGFTVRGTTKDLIFKLFEIVTDKENDIVSWKLYSTDGKFLITVFND